MLALRCQGPSRTVLAARGVLEAPEDATWAAAQPPDRFGIRAAAPSRARGAAGRRGPARGDRSRADDHARWQRERAESRAHTKQVTLELAEAIEVGDAACRQLGRRLDAYGNRLEAVRARLYRS